MQSSASGGVILGDLAEGGQEHAVGQLHDVGLMDCSHLFTAVGGSVIKGKTADALGKRAW